MAESPRRPPVLRGVGLAKRFRAPDGRVLDVLRGADVTLAPGELVAVVGRSGSGKSTLLNLLGCLDRSDGGELWFGDERLTGAGRGTRARFRGRHLGFVFQAYNLIPELTAWENVLLAARYVGRARAETERAARDLLERLGVADRAAQYPPTLSGGEQQRVAFCRAVLND
ncbi:MAG: ABC transporter ATP-binding protein, partial [Candidatus Rokuibacteriota bacterium]